MSSGMYCFVGDKNHLTVVLDTAQSTSAIVAGLGFVSITAPRIIITVAVTLYLYLKDLMPDSGKAGFCYYARY